MTDTADEPASRQRGLVDYYQMEKAQESQAHEYESVGDCQDVAVRLKTLDTGEPLPQFAERDRLMVTVKPKPDGGYEAIRAVKVPGAEPELCHNQENKSIAKKAWELFRVVSSNKLLYRFPP